MIHKLGPNDVFVFGSNTAGRHGGGAARQAAVSFGAKYGVGEGLTGQCYAFPTLDDHLGKRTMSELKESVRLLFECARANPGKCFLLTKVGCGIAGFTEDEIRPLFAGVPANILLPEDWQDIAFAEAILDPDGRREGREAL